MAVRAGGEALIGEIQVKLLGPLEVEVAGEPVRFDGAKQRTLFVVLALLSLASFEAVSAMPQVARELPATLASGARILDLVDREAAVRDPTDPAPIPRSPVVALEGVVARYAELSPPPGLIATTEGKNPGARHEAIRANRPPSEWPARILNGDARYSFSMNGASSFLRNCMNASALRPRSAPRSLCSTATTMCGGIA